MAPAQVTNLTLCHPTLPLPYLTSSHDLPQRSTDIPGGAGVGSKQGDGKGEGPSRSEGRGRGSPRGMARGGLPMARGYPMGRARGKDGEPKPDLQKLGMKFGGQISITSTGNQAKKSNRGDNDGQVSCP